MKRVFITGASSGIGEALARRYAEQGAMLGLAARRETALRELVAQLPNPDRHRIYPLDVTDAGALRAAAEDFIDAGGGVDVVIANAGVSRGTLTEIPEDMAVFERIVALEEDASADDLVVHDIPLLAESGRASTFDAVLVVHAPEDVQIERMVRDRGWTEEEARARIAAQAAAEDRLAIATHVIDNTGTLEELRQRVTEVVAELGR